MWEPLILLVPVLVLLAMGVGLFIILPTKWAIVAAVVCVVLAGYLIGKLGNIRFI